MGFERLAAGVIVIGLIVFGASILATPDEARAQDVEPVSEVHEPLDAGDVTEDAPADEGEEEEAEEDEVDRDDGDAEPAEPRRKGRKGGPG